ncbi:MAG TPA: type II toxin-antitoxin system VapC family toxin [Thermoanaerobaculia bacterium]|jgi:tRNA(fMet)-specific endonuclease VapC|nr:type II toxin-antitoxin system VapC family toxin [Thermoanaerobaculia bacterium]
MKYLLDANAVIALLNDAKSKTARRARRQKPGDVGVSTIVLHELYYGANKSQRVALNVAAVDALRFSMVDFDEEDARNAGELRALLRSRGTPIGPYDVLIAGQAKARRLTLVTRNTAEFARIPDLRIEDWEIVRSKKK